MKYRMLVVLLIFAALAGISCKKRDNKLPDPNAIVPEYATIAPSKVMFLELAKAELVADLSLIQIDAWKPVKDDIDLASYSWGVLVANAQVYILNNKASALKSAVDELILLAPALKLEKVGEKLKADILPKVAQADWQWLQTAIYSMQSEVDRLMNEREDFQHYTLIKLGEWSQSTQMLAALATQKDDADFSGILLQAEAWNSIAQNLNLLSKKDDKPSVQVSQAQAAVSKIQGFHKNAASKPLSAEQLTQLTTLTSDISSIFSKLE